MTFLLLVGVLSGCGDSTEGGATESTGANKDNTLKVLTLGHSLAVDSGHMLAMVAHAEGRDGLKVGTLYYSGCPLGKHVEYLTKNSPEYILYLSSTENPDEAPQAMESVTMQDALVLDEWDVIVMQGGVFEVGKDPTYQANSIQTIQKYVNENKLNPDAVFAWHMFWVPPLDNSLRDMYPDPQNNTYYTNYKDFQDDRSVLYDAVTGCVEKHILSDDTFSFMIPSGTAMENALSSYLEEKDLYRDYAHASDLGRVIAAYTWYCRLYDVDALDEIKLDVIPKKLFKSTKLTEDRVLTDSEKQIILESVNNALKEPLKMTPSAYTTAP